MVLWVAARAEQVRPAVRARPEQLRTAAALAKPAQHLTKRAVRHRAARAQLRVEQVEKAPLAASRLEVKATPLPGQPARAARWLWQGRAAQARRAPQGALHAQDPRAATAASRRTFPSCSVTAPTQRVCPSTKPPRTCLRRFRLCLDESSHVPIIPPLRTGRFHPSGRGATGRRALSIAPEPCVCQRLVCAFAVDSRAERGPVCFSHADHGGLS